MYDAHEKLYQRYGRTAKAVEEATNARLASVSIVKWVIFLRTKRKERRLGKISLLCKPKLRVKPITCYPNPLSMWVNAIWFWTRGFRACKPKLRVTRVRTKRKWLYCKLFAFMSPMQVLNLLWKEHKKNWRKFMPYIYCCCCRCCCFIRKTQQAYLGLITAGHSEIFLQILPESVQRRSWSNRWWKRVPKKSASEKWRNSARASCCTGDAEWKR